MNQEIKEYKSKVSWAVSSTCGWCSGDRLVLWKAETLRLTCSFPPFFAGQQSLSNSRDISAMDTLPLNGNFNNSYSLRDDDYEAVGVRAPGDLGGLNLDDAAFEKLIISEIVHNNLRPRGAPKGRDAPRERDRVLPPQTRVTVDRGGGGGGSGSEDDAIVADHADASSPQRGSGRGGHATLELLLHPHHKEVLEAPLLPQRTHSLLYSSQKAPRCLEGQSGHGSETVTAEEDMGSHSPSNNRDSLYTSMPNLRDSPSPSASPYPPEEEEEELSPSPQSESEDAYHKSMPELGDAPQPLSYYHINRGTSDGCIIPPNNEDCAHDGEAPADGQMQLITSLWAGDALFAQVLAGRVHRREPASLAPHFTRSFCSLCQDKKRKVVGWKKEWMNTWLLHTDLINTQNTSHLRPDKCGLWRLCCWTKEEQRMTRRPR